MDKQNLIQRLTEKREEAQQVMDMVITDLKNTVQYLQSERDSMVALPVEGARKEDEEEYIAAFISLLMQAGSNARVGKLTKRAVSIGMLRQQLDNLDTQ